MLTARLDAPRRFTLLDLPEPPQPSAGEVKIRVERVGICGSDISAYYGRHPYIHCPIILGHEFAGVVEDVGPGVVEPKIGDRCTVVPHLICGECSACREGKYNLCGSLRVIGAQADGAFTRFINVPSEMAIKVPDSLSMEQAALVEPAAVGYHAAHRGSPLPQEIALIFGAGPIGMFTMQSVKAAGVKSVLIADKDASRLRLALTLGVDGTIDTSSETIEAGLSRLVGGSETVDVFYDCVGFGGNALDEIICIARRGVRVVVAGVLESNYSVPHLPDFVEHELSLIGSTMYIPQDFRDVIDLMAADKIRIEGMISHSVPLEQVKDIYQMIDSRSESFFKIILRT